MLILMTVWWFNWSRLSADGEDFFTSYDEVYDTFDSMGLVENLLRGIYAYGMYEQALLIKKKLC